MIKEIIDSCPKSVDLTNSGHLDKIINIVERLLNKYNSHQKLDKLENELVKKNDRSLIFILLAIKIARSKLIIESIQNPVTISVVFAVYKEHNRIRRSSEHPHGEDFLLRKVKQLEWLFKDSSNFKWELILVDDGCPEKTGVIAQKIVNENKLSKKVKILFLEDAIKQNLPIIESISSTSESQKGGAIIYGMYFAVKKNKEKNHIVIYTDADLSTHLAQVGLLIDPIMKLEKNVAIGSRREKRSVVIKKGDRNSRGKLFIYLWKRLIPNLEFIIDTQCGFKAFKKEIVMDIIYDLIEKKFAFDIELLLKSELIQKNSIEKVPIAWIDSEAASTTTDLQPYLPMLTSIVKMYEKYFEPAKTSNEFASFIKALDEEIFNDILNNIPDEILKREPYEFSNFDGVSVEDLSKIIKDQNS